MTKLYRLNASGTLVDSTGSSRQTIEIWSNTMHALYPDSATDVTVLGQWSTAWSTFFQNPFTHISPYARTTLLKANVIDIATGLQITDPTLYQEVDYAGGATSSAIPPATFISQRVSCDDGTRNPRARGGFYLPRFSSPMNNRGRYEPEDMANVAAQAKILIQTFDSTTGDEIPVAVIYSTTAREAFPIRRVRVGDVPDVITHRKNAMRENYATLLV